MTKALLILMTGLFLAGVTSASTSISCERVLINLVNQDAITSQAISGFHPRSVLQLAQINYSRERAERTAFIFNTTNRIEAHWAQQILNNLGGGKIIVPPLFDHAPDSPIADALATVTKKIKDEGPHAKSINRVVVINSSRSSNSVAANGVEYAAMAADGRSGLKKFFDSINWPITRMDLAVMIYTSHGEQGLKDEGFNASEIEVLRNYFSKI